MIRNFDEHAANERNFLAWIRTSISLTGLGIILEKSDDWLKLSGSSSIPIIDEFIGLTFIALGTILMFTSTLRLKKLGHLIDSVEENNWDPIHPFVVPTKMLHVT